MAMDSPSLVGGIKVTSKNLFLRHSGGDRNLTIIMLSSLVASLCRDDNERAGFFIAYG